LVLQSEQKNAYYLISLVEMELAIATSFDHNKLHQKFDAHPQVLETYQTCL
jgi:hypothetical protein